MTPLPSMTIPNWAAPAQVGCSVFVTFLYSLRSESKQIWILFASYLHVLVHSLTPFIHISCFIFTSKYSHKFACNYSFSHTGEYLHQNICFEVNIHKTLSKLYIQANIREQIFTYKQILSCKYLLSIASNYIGKAFTSLKPQLIFVILNIRFILSQNTRFEAK
jgi:hypothetical protein